MSLPMREVTCVVGNDRLGLPSLKLYTCIFLWISGDTVYNYERYTAQLLKE